jgi:hypothetical protein
VGRATLAAHCPARPATAGWGTDGEDCGQRRHHTEDHDARKDEVLVGDVPAGRGREPGPEQDDQGDRGRQAGQGP